MTKQVGALSKATVSVQGSLLPLEISLVKTSQTQSADEGHEKKIKLLHFLMKRNKIYCKWILCLDIKCSGATLH